MGLFLPTMAHMGSKPKHPMIPSSVGDPGGARVQPGGARVQPGVGEGDSEGDLGGGEDGALPGVLLQPGGAQGAGPVLLEVEHAATCQVSKLGHRFTHLHKHLYAERKES